jgi:hypothetical protein
MTTETTSVQLLRDKRRVNLAALKLAARVGY